MISKVLVAVSLDRSFDSIARAQFPDGFLSSHPEILHFYSVNTTIKYGCGDCPIEEAVLARTRGLRNAATLPAAAPPFYL